MYVHESTIQHLHRSERRLSEAEAQMRRHARDAREARDATASKQGSSRAFRLLGRLDRGTRRGVSAATTSTGVLVIAALVLAG
jgi:hypothetical protein